MDGLRCLIGIHRWRGIQLMLSSQQAWLLISRCQRCGTRKTTFLLNDWEQVPS